MSIYNRVSWTDGMDLLTQHFQQAERSRERIDNQRLQLANPLAWGVAEVAFDGPAITQGRLELLRCRAVLPDGTWLDCPDVDPLPAPRSFELAPTSEKLEVFLTLPVHRQGQPLSIEGPERADLRYQRKVEDIADVQEPDQVQPVEVLVPNLRLVLEGEATDGLVCLKIGEIRRGEDGTPELDARFIPPIVKVKASPALDKLVRELVGTVIAKARNIEEKLPLQGPAEIDLRPEDMMSFWFLHTLNQHIPVFRNLLEQPDVHPAKVFEEFLRLGGGLTTFERSGPVELPKYDHQHLTEAFSSLRDSIRGLLGFVVQSPVEVITLERQRSYWVGHIADLELRQQGQFVLVVTAEGMTSEEIVEKFPGACKIAEVSAMGRLVRTFVGGVKISYLPNAPSYIPGPRDGCHFVIQPQGDDWALIKQTGNIAVYVAGWLTGVRLELVGVRPKGPDGDRVLSPGIGY